VVSSSVFDEPPKMDANEIVRLGAGASTGVAFGGASSAGLPKPNSDIVGLAFGADVSDGLSAFTCAGLDRAAA
jgi:hypothetical protein